MREWGKDNRRGLIALLIGLGVLKVVVGDWDPLSMEQKAAAVIVVVLLGCYGLCNPGAFERWASVCARWTNACYDGAARYARRIRRA